MIDESVESAGWLASLLAPPFLLPTLEKGSNLVNFVVVRLSILF